MYNKKNNGGTVALSETPQLLENDNLSSESERINRKDGGAVKEEKYTSDKLPDGYYRQNYKRGLL